MRPDAITATGRSDYPNQINNVLGFPFIFRGALDVRARAINDEMKMAATRALAELARQDVPEAVERAYGDERFRFGADYLIPKPFDPRIMLWVAPAVARGGDGDGGGAGGDRPGRVPRGAGVAARARPRGDARHPQPGAARPAAHRLPRGRARADHPRGRAGRGGADRRARCCWAGPRASRRGATELGDLAGGRRAGGPGRGRGAARSATRRSSTGSGSARASRSPRRASGMRQPIYFGCMMVRRATPTASSRARTCTTRRRSAPRWRRWAPARDVEHVAGLYMMVLENGPALLRRHHRQHRPRRRDAGGDRARWPPAFVRGAGHRAARGDALLLQLRLGAPPAGGEDAPRDGAGEGSATRELMIDGEMQVETRRAPARSARRSTPSATLSGAANVLIFPDLNSANIAYKLLARLGGAEAIGPILMGMARAGPRAAARQHRGRHPEPHRARGGGRAGARAERRRRARCA